MQARMIERFELLGTGAAIVALSLFLGLTLLVLGRLASSDAARSAYSGVAELSRLQQEVQGLIISAERYDQHEVLQGWRSVEIGLNKASDTISAVLVNSVYPSNFLSWLDDIDLPMRRLARMSTPDPAAFRTIRVQAEQLRFAVRGATNAVLDHGSQQLVARATDVANAIWGIVACVTASLLCWAWLVVRLIKAVRRSRRAEAEVRRHNEILEHLVAERTRTLADTEAQLRNAISTAPDGFAAFDVKGRLFVANDIAQEYFPDTDTSLIAGRSLNDVIFATKAFAEPTVVASNPGIHSAEVEGSAGNWTRITVRQAPDGTAVMRFADISAHKQATHALEQAVVREQNLRRLYRDFVAIVSHQFRTPLSIIDSGAQKILRRGAGAAWTDVADRAQQIRNAVSGLVALVDSTLDSVSLDHGEMAFRPQDVNLRPFLLDLGRRLQEVYQERRLNLEVGELPSPVRCDPLLLEHVIGNLVSNSAKYSADGAPVSIMAEASLDAVSIVVSDQGVGIPHEELDRVFELSYRGRNSRGHTGSGVGLHFVRQIVRLHGGDIRVVSTIGSGTTVTLDLPIEGPPPRLAA